MAEPYEYDNSVYNDRMNTVMYILFCYPEMSISEAFDKLDDPEFLEELLKKEI